MDEEEEQKSRQNQLEKCKKEWEDILSRTNQFEPKSSQKSNLSSGKSSQKSNQSSSRVKPNGHQRASQSTKGERKPSSDPTSKQLTSAPGRHKKDQNQDVAAKPRKNCDHSKNAKEKGGGKVEKSPMSQLEASESVDTVTSPPTRTAVPAKENGRSERPNSAVRSRRKV